MKNLSYSFFVFALLSVFSACKPPIQLSVAESLVASVGGQFAPDKRIAVYEIGVEKAGAEAIVLRGETNLPEAHKVLLDSLGSLDYQVIDSIRILPDTLLGDRTWGLVTLSVIPMRSAPKYSAEMVSQTLMGTPVKLLDKKGGWYRIQTPDLYIGWVSSSGVETRNEEQMEEWKASGRYVFNQISGWALEAPKTDANPVSDLVLGNIVEGGETVNGFLQIKFPDGRAGFVKASDCLPISQWEAIQPEAANVIATAKKLFGSPYLWGGTSTKGIDCSGFVKTAYFSQGVMLARDASQQAGYGQPLPVDKLNFRPGDLLFFGSSATHITHVGLYMGNNHFIHSSGRVKINSFNPKDEDYDPDRRGQLVAARRILNSLNTGQIIQIKYHPWYN